MEYFSKNVKKKIKLAKKCDNLIQDIEELDDFKKYFHIRVNSDNYVIVNTLRGAKTGESGYYMNGLTCNQTNLKERVNSLISRMRDMDDDRIDELVLQEYPQRRYSKNYYEYEYQAKFIRALCGDEKYRKLYDAVRKQLGINNDDLQFVASEFTLYSNEDNQNEKIKQLNSKYGRSKNRRVDVVGVCDDTLFYFELKRSDESYNNVFDQINDYRDYYSIRREEVRALLKEYPLFPAAFRKERFVLVAGLGETVDIEKVNCLYQDKNNMSQAGPIIDKRDIIAF